MTDPTVRERAWTVKDIMLWSTGYLKERGFTSPRLDVELLLCKVLQCSRVELYTGIEKPVNADERKSFKDFLRRRALGEPCAYILGEREFYGLTFFVNEHVLIPRPDTEVLVEAVINHAKASGELAEFSILDIGTGSGCIALSLKKHFMTKAYVEAWDIDPLVLGIAQKNMDFHGVEVVLKQCDVLSSDPWPTDRKFDYIISNPPYIKKDDINLDPFVAKFEPHKALFAEDNGFRFYRHLADTSRARLKSDGHLVFEVGIGMAPEVRSILQSQGFSDVSLIKDLGGVDRVIIASLD